MKRPLKFLDILLTFLSTIITIYFSLIPEYEFRVSYSVIISVISFLTSFFVYTLIKIISNKSDEKKRKLEESLPEFSEPDEDGNYLISESTAEKSEEYDEFIKSVLKDTDEKFESGVIINKIIEADYEETKFQKAKRLFVFGLWSANEFYNKCLRSNNFIISFTTKLLTLSLLCFLFVKISIWFEWTSYNISDFKDYFIVFSVLQEELNFATG